MNTLSSFRRKFKYGFTLIELLLVIGIIAILAAIVIVAINPTKQLGDARDSQRRSDVNTLLNAVYQYAIDNNGSLPGDLGSGDLVTAVYGLTGAQVCGISTGGTACWQRGNIFLGQLTGSYLTDIPADPRFASGATVGIGQHDRINSAYFVSVDANGRVTFSAPFCENENGECPEVTR